VNRTDPKVSQLLLDLLIQEQSIVRILKDTVPGQRALARNSGRPSPFAPCVYSSQPVGKKRPRSNNDVGFNGGYDEGEDLLLAKEDEEDDEGEDGEDDEDDIESQDGEEEEEEEKAPDAPYPIKRRKLEGDIAGVITAHEATLKTLEEDSAWAAFCDRLQLPTLIDFTLSDLDKEAVLMRALLLAFQARLGITGLDVNDTIHIKYDALSHALLDEVKAGRMGDGRDFLKTYHGR
jgi:hypothetical protein